MIEIACSTHAFLVDSALFAGPVVICALALWIAVRRDRAGEEEPASVDGGLLRAPRSAP